jgi:protocatechuate 3,4-dioxygenase beta subunit
LPREGDYDNMGFRLRGYLFADPKGHYAFRTIVPGLYPGEPGTGPLSDRGAQYVLGILGLGARNSLARRAHG